MTRTAHLPQAGEFYLFSRQDFQHAGDDREWELEPGITGSVNDWLAVELHSHIEKPGGESAAYEATAVATYFRLTPRDARFSLAGSVEFEATRDDGEPNAWQFAGIASWQNDAWLFAVNLIADREAMSSADTRWAYAAGARRPVSARIAAGVEVAGSLEDDHAGEVLLGLFATPTERVTINAGIGTGINDGPDLTFRSALVFRFR